MEQSALKAQLGNSGVRLMDHVKPGALNTLKHQLTEVSTQSSKQHKLCRSGRCDVAAITRTLQHWPAMAVKGALSKILET